MKRDPKHTMIDTHDAGDVRTGEDHRMFQMPAGCRLPATSSQECARMMAGMMIHEGGLNLGPTGGLESMYRVNTRTLRVNDARWKKKLQRHKPAVGKCRVTRKQ